MVRTTNPKNRSSTLLSTARKYIYQVINLKYIPCLFKITYGLPQHQYSKLRQEYWHPWKSNLIKIWHNPFRCQEYLCIILLMTFAKPFKSPIRTRKGLKFEGHRGAGLLEAENTLRAFKRAIDLDLDGVELDVYH